MIPNIRKIVQISIASVAGFSIAILVLISAPEPISDNHESAKFVPADQPAVEVLAELIKAAEKEIFIQSGTLRDKGIISILRDRAKEGVQIQFLFSKNDNPDLRSPKFLVGWLLANKIGNISITNEDLPQGIIGIDGEKLFAFQGKLDSQEPTGIMYAPADSAFYDSLEQVIVDAFAVSRPITLQQSP